MSDPSSTQQLPNESADETISSGDPSVGDRITHYIVERRLATGGMATVFVVRDTRDQSEWALKLLHPLDADDGQQTRFRREFRALSRLAHPNVLRVRDWGLRGDRPWFTMELVDGVDLRAAIQDWADLDPADRFTRAQSITVQVARALAYIHERGLIHRDVTPSNIMVQPDGSVKLMDFGLVKEQQQAELTRAGEVVGTVAYIAPEQITGTTIDARADLYALGTVLYLMLTGRKPFAAHTLHGYMDKHLHEAPKPPKEIDPLVPDLLQKVCLRLLDKDPADRFASATHLLHVLGDVAFDDIEDRWPPRTVGRTPVKAWIREAFDDIMAGRAGNALLITGPTGQGKTRMLELAESEARRRGITWAKGRCRPHDRPFGAFVSVYKTLRTAGSPDVLEAAFGGDAADEHVERYPIIAAFRELIAAQSPCVILIDQLERADAATRELLEYLIRNLLKLADVPVVFVMAYEADHGLLPPILRSIPSVQRRHLGPLQRAEVEELVLSVLPDSPASSALAGRLFDETGGSPAFLSDMLRGLVDEGFIRRAGPRFELLLAPEEISRSRLPMPASLRQVLEDRLAPLPPDAAEVGRILAISRRSLDLDAILEAAPFGEERLMAAIDALADADIVLEKRVDDVERVELSHNRFRDVLASPLDPDEHRARHRRMGEILERQNRHALTPVVEDLAYHFEQAGVPPKAYAYLIQTAKKHLRRSLYEESLAFLERSLNAEAAARPYLLLDDADRMLFEVQLSRAQALYHLGRWNMALSAARVAETLAAGLQDPARQSMVAAELGYQLRNHGQVDEAEPQLRRALQFADRADRPDLRPQCVYHLGAIAWGRGDLSGAEKLWTEALETSRTTRDIRAEGMAHNGLGIIAMCQGRASEARRLLEKSSELFERLGMLQQLAITRVNLVELHVAMGNLRKAMRLCERTVAQAREVHHLHGIALGLMWRARLLLTLGRQEEARCNALESLRITRELGTVDDEITAITTLIEVMLEMGMGEHAMSRVTELLELLDRHDPEGTRAHAHAIHAQVLVAEGELEQAERRLDTPPELPEYPIMRVQTELEFAKANQRIGRTQIAEQFLKNALELAQLNGYRYYQLLAHHALAEVASDPEEREQHQRVSRSLCRAISASLPRAEATDFQARGWGIACS